MTATGETTLPVTPSVARAPRQDRAGLVWGAVLGTAMLAVALVVALGGGTAPAAGEARTVISAGTCKWSLMNIATATFGRSNNPWIGDSTMRHAASVHTGTK